MGSWEGAKAAADWIKRSPSVAQNGLAWLYYRSFRFSSPWDEVVPLDLSGVFDYYDWVIVPTRTPLEDSEGVLEFMKNIAWPTVISKLCGQQKVYGPAGDTGLRVVELAKENDHGWMKYRLDYNSVRALVDPFDYWLEDGDLQSSPPLPAPSPLPRPGSPTFLVSVNSGKVIDGGGSGGRSLIQWSRNGGAHQLWKVEPLGNGEVKIVSLATGKVFDVPDSSAESGLQIELHSWHGASNQRWRLEPLGGDEFRIVSVVNGLVLDVKASSLNDGDEIIQWDWQDSENQRWRKFAP